MLDYLLGSKSAERILLFLLVNEYCYISQIQKAYQISLTPLQSMMRKLERGGIVTFDMRGKRKLYRLHPNYPLLKELKTLLQKGFTYLSSEEKKHLFTRKEQWRNRSFEYSKRIASCLDRFWKRLLRVCQVTIQTGVQTMGEAVGEVKVQEEKKGVLLFFERGQWLPQEIEFNNCLRWSFDYENGLVGLEHLRYGPNHPVFLFHLAPITTRYFQSIDSHLCCNDCYFGQIELNEQSIQFLWRILGPQKNEILHYTYA